MGKTMVTHRRAFRVSESFGAVRRCPLCGECAEEAKWEVSEERDLYGQKTYSCPACGKIVVF